MHSDPLGGRRIPVLGSIVLACLLASCSGDDATRPEFGSGLYRLESVHGQPLPYFNPS